MDSAAFSEEQNQRKRAKWSRWADDLSDDDEEQHSAAKRDCRRIVNETALLRTANTSSKALKIAAPSTKKFNNLPVPNTINEQPKATNPISQQPIQQPPSPPALIVRRAEDDVLTVFCDEDMTDLNPRPDTPEVKIIAVTKPKERPKLPDLRETLNKRNQSLPDRERMAGRESTTGREVVSRRPRDNSGRPSSSGYHGYPYNANRFAPPYNGPGRNNRDRLPKIELSDVCRNFLRMGGCPRSHCRFVHRLPTPREDSRFEPPTRRPALPPPPGPDSREHQGYPGHGPDNDGRIRPRLDNRLGAAGPPVEHGNSGANRFQHEQGFDLRPALEQDRRKQENEERTYKECVQELLKQNGQLQEHLRRLEQQHHDLEVHAIDHHHDFARRLERLAEFQRSFVMQLWRSEPSLRRTLEGSPSLTSGSSGSVLQRSGQHGSVLQRSGQNGILGAKPPGHSQENLPVDQLLEARLAQQLIFQRRLQNGLGLTEEQLLLQHGVFDYDHGALMDQYWRYV